MKTAEMFENGIPYMDRLVYTWVTLITAINDTFDSFYVAWISISERYLSLSFWHFFFPWKWSYTGVAMCHDEQIKAKNLSDEVNLIILFNLAPSRMLYDKYFSSYEFLKINLRNIFIEFFSIFHDFL